MDQIIKKIGAFNSILTNSKLITSCTEYLDYVFSIQNEQKKNKLLWFRGVSSDDHLPVPKLLRKKVNYEPKLEHFLMTQFVLKARNYNYNLQSKFEWLQVMQHYGLPTRLLDWTEGALIALFFAVKYDGEVKTPSVWIMNPLELNMIVTKKNSIYVTDKIVEEDADSFLENYQDYDNLPEHPVAISPSYIDKRIQVQKSVFTLHGKDHGDILKPAIAENMNLHLLRIESKCSNRIRKQLAFQV